MNTSRGHTAVCLTLLAVIPLIVCAYRSAAQVIQSKHNLSVSGPGTVRSTTEQQVCKFCHIPHKATSTVPLWDHALSSVTYSRYTSGTFTSTYLTQYPSTSSKLCLSCHDGTIAVGSISMGLIPVTGGQTLDADQSLAGTASSNVGGLAGDNLSDDHPISIGTPHFTASQYKCAGCHYPRPADTVPMECVRCHDPHTEGRDAVTKRFLAQNNQASALCTSCHNKTYWSTGPSIHQSSPKSMSTGWSHTGYTTVNANGCEGCHKPHAAGGATHLMKNLEEKTCDGCHKGTANGGITDKNVSAEAGGAYLKTYRHPTYTVAGRHAPTNASPVTSSPTETSVNMSGGNRHAECADCHNPHAAKSGLHTVRSNALSNVLAGVWGLEPAVTTAWTQPLSFTRIDPATKEYQICLKCHSYYGLGTAPTGVTTIIGPSGTNVTDQAMEYNANNYAAHPVVTALGSQTGSYAPRALVAAQMSTTWNTPGTQTMYCSDCHGSDATPSATVPAGPHGSNYRFLLTGTGKYWPTRPAGTPWSLNDVRNNLDSWQTNLFCANCHPLYTAGQWKNNVHSQSVHQGTTVYCITCHVVVPHGSKRSRLIGYASEPSPYNYAGTGTYAKLILTGFRKATTPNGYSENNCSMNNGVCHGARSNTFDP